MMILGLVSQELYEQLLDPKNYQNRTNGVEELKHVLSELDFQSVPSDSVEEFISFLCHLLDDNNFKVLYGTLQVTNLLIQKLDSNVDRYFKQIASVALKALGDTRTVTRVEYMNVFRQLTGIVGPQKVLDLVIGNLRHKNSRVREDVLDIITAAMLTHPRKYFNIPNLCFQVAPCLADSKRKVRHAALELFAVFDYCLDTGKKQPLVKAVDMVELNEDVEGLMEAVQARRARHILPRLSSEGTVEYALAVPKPGQRCSPQFGLGADMEWVLRGGRINSARSSRAEADSDRLYGYGSLGSLTDDLPLQRRVVSAGKGKNKLPWEMSSLSSTENDQPCSVPNGKSSEKIPSEDGLSITRRSPESYIPSFEPEKRPSHRRRQSPARLRRSGSLDLDPDILKSINIAEPQGVTPKARILSGTPSVERTFFLPSNTTVPGSFLLPSYPLAALPGGLLALTQPCRRVDTSLSMSNTWPNKREGSPHQRGSSPWGDSGDQSSGKCSPRPPRASLVSTSSTSSFRRALSSTRTALPVSVLLPPSECAHSLHSHNAQRCDAPGSPQNQQTERNLNLDFASSNAMQLLEEDEPLDVEEMLNSLRSLRNSAAKKRAKANTGGSEPDSPDSAMKLDLTLDSPSRGSPMVTSPASESGLSSLYSPPDSTLNGTKTSPRNAASSAAKPRIARVPSGKLRSSVSMEFSSLQGFSQRDRASSEVGVIGQRLSYINGDARDGDRTGEPSPTPVKPTCRELLRALRPKAKGSPNGQSSAASDVQEGVVGRGMFGSAVLSSHQGIPTAFEVGDFMANHASDIPAGICGNYLGNGDNLMPEETKERVRSVQFGWEKLRPQRPDQTEDQSFVGEHLRDRPRHRVKQVPLDGPGEVNTDFHLSSNAEWWVAPTKSEPPPLDGSSVSPGSPGSPMKCFTPPHQPSPPTVPPTSKTLPRLRRPPSLSRTRPSLSHSSDELSAAALAQKRDPSESPELRPFSKPDLVLTQSFSLLGSEDWEKKIEGLTFLRCLARHHADTLHGRLHDVCLALIQEVKNLRSGVSRVAVCALGDLYSHLQRSMDQELEWTAKALLQKTVESNSFIRQDVDAALGCMVQHCTPSRSIAALLAGGLSHLNVVVRRCAAQHLADVVEKVGATRILSGGKDLTDRILPAVTKLAQDSSQEVRYFGRRMLLSLSSQADFDNVLVKYIPAKDLVAMRDIVCTLKAKGLGEMPQDAPSARGRRSHPGSGTVRASSLTREPYNQTTRSVVTAKTEYTGQISALLGSKDFRDRMKGIDQLEDDCLHNPDMVVNSIFRVFDAFTARLQESNSKVNLHALESLQRIVRLMKDSLSPVVNILVPAIVDNHLNSKNNAIYAAATGAINELMLNLDNTVLLQPFCTKAQFLSGRAKVELIDKVAELVTELYPVKPRVVQQKVLPLLWHLVATVGNSGSVHGRGGVRGATAGLCQALHAQMGPGLSECAAAQSANVRLGLSEFLRNPS